MNKPVIVGFAGPAGSGKDTAGAYLIKEHGFKKLSFASPLKAMLAAAGFPEPDSQDAKEARIDWLGRSWRELAQTLGTEWGRTCVHPDLWVLLAARRAQAEGGYFVVTDVRFPNEAAMIRNMGGLVCHLEGRQHTMAETTKRHVSEAGLPVLNADYRISNTGSLDQLHRQVANALGCVGIHVGTPWVPTR